MARSTPRARHFNRYRQILSVFMRYGFRDWLGQLGLLEGVNLDEAGPSSPVDSAARASAAERFRLALEELGPTFMKLGQILSTRPDLLPPEFIVELTKLQNEATPLPYLTIKELIERELDQPIEAAFQFVAVDPIGTASLAQVHAARLRDGVDVVVKVQRPGIETNIRADLDILQDVAGLLQNVRNADRLINLPEIAEDFAYTLWQELDFEQEGRNADTFRQNFAGEDQVRFPMIYWAYTTPRLLVMEHLRGMPINDIASLDRAGHDRHEVASQAARFIIKEILEDGFFHADPHPGNLVVLRDGVIGVMDFGMVGWLSYRLRQQLAQLFIALARRDTDAVVTRLLQINIAPPDVDQAKLSRDLTRLLRKYHGRQLSNIRAGDFLGDLTPIVRRHRLRIPTELWLLFKALVILQGVGMHLDPRFNLFADAQPFIRQLSLAQWSPNALQESAIRTSVSLSDLLNTTPELLRKAEEGQIKLIIEIAGLQEILGRVSEITDRLNVAIILAAIILGLSLLLPSLQGAPLWVIAFFFLMLALALVMGLLLAWRSVRGR